MYVGKENRFPYCQVIFPPDCDTPQQKQELYNSLQDIIKTRIVQNKFGESVPTLEDQTFAVCTCKTGFYTEHRGNTVLRIIATTKTHEEAVALCLRIRNHARLNIENETPIIVPVGLAHWIRDTSIRTPHTALITDPAEQSLPEQQAVHEIETFLARAQHVRDTRLRFKKQREERYRRLLAKYAKIHAAHPLPATPADMAERELNVACAVYDVPGNGNLPMRVRERMRAHTAEEYKRLATTHYLSCGVMPKDQHEFHFFCERTKDEFLAGRGGAYQTYRDEAIGQ